MIHPKPSFSSVGNIGRGMPAGAEAEVLASGAGVGVVARKIAGRENRGAHGPIAHRSGLAELLEVADIGEHLRNTFNRIRSST